MRYPTVAFPVLIFLAASGAPVSGGPKCLRRCRRRRRGGIPLRRGRRRRAGPFRSRNPSPITVPGPGSGRRWREVIIRGVHAAVVRNRRTGPGTSPSHGTCTPPTSWPSEGARRADAPRRLLLQRPDRPARRRAGAKESGQERRRLRADRAGDGVGNPEAKPRVRRGRDLGGDDAAVKAQDYQEAVREAIEAAFGLPEGGFDTLDAGARKMLLENAGTIPMDWNAPDGSAASAATNSARSPPPTLLIVGAESSILGSQRRAIAACIPGSRSR